MKSYHLQCSDDTHKSGDVIEAGLPNITGDLSARGSIAWQGGSGAFYMSGESAGASASASGTSAYGTTAAFDASRSNDIYGKSKTVQPYSIVLNIWRRVS